MLHFVPPSLNNSNNTNQDKQKIIYWKVTLAFPQIKPLEFIVSTLSEFALITGINYLTLRRIVYDKSYHCKKFDTVFKYISITPVYG